jgi:hypothetical protein
MLQLLKLNEAWEQRTQARDLSTIHIFSLICFITRCIMSCCPFSKLKIIALNDRTFKINHLFITNHNDPHLNTKPERNETKLHNNIILYPDILITR